MLDLKSLMPDDWRQLMEPDISSGRFQKLQMLLAAEYQTHPDLIQPPPEKIFRALQLTPVDKVRVVILGQDPYQTPGLAQGLAFSVPKQIKPGWRSFPSSLRNIGKAISLDGCGRLDHGDLTDWALQGVLLLNASLTVRLEVAASHALLGWQEFTDLLIARLAKRNTSIVWLLWGSHAQKKADLIRDAGGEHLILQASHPSGLSVYKTVNPFIYPGDQRSCNHFKLANEYLLDHGLPAIDWAIS